MRKRANVSVGEDGFMLKNEVNNFRSKNKNFIVQEYDQNFFSLSYSRHKKQTSFYFKKKKHD